MKSEMDSMRLDERQRLHWLMANRVTLMLVGVVWLAMIAWEVVYRATVPYFLIAMVPVFAAVRFITFLYYSRQA